MYLCAIIYLLSNSEIKRNCVVIVFVLTLEEWDFLDWHFSNYGPNLVQCYSVSETSRLLVKYPGKSVGMKFIPNRSDLFRNLYPSQSEPIRVNPKKMFNLVWCKSVDNFESEWIRSIFESWWIGGRNYSDWKFSLNRSHLGFIRIKNFFRIDSD